jgi:hypothetical protein
MKDRPTPVVVPHQSSTEHLTRCPICGNLVDKLDPEHDAPAKN